jgi:hypothetical protein
LRSRIRRASSVIFSLTHGGASYLLEIGKRRITNQERMINDEVFRRILRGRIRVGEGTYDRCNNDFEQYFEAAGAFVSPPVQLLDRQ